MSSQKYFYQGSFLESFIILVNFFPQTLRPKTTMTFESSLKTFASDLADSLRTHCHTHLTFDSWIVVTGHLCLQVDTQQKVYLNVDQKITTENKESAVISFSVPTVLLDRNSLDGMSADEMSDSGSLAANDPNDRNKEEKDFTLVQNRKMETGGENNYCS